MGRMADYALEVAMSQQAEVRRKKNSDDRKNLPTASRDAQVDMKIADCIKQGINLEDAVRVNVEWNAMLPSPMKVGLVKKRVYQAYVAAGVKADQ